MTQKKRERKLGDSITRKIAHKLLDNILNSDCMNSKRAVKVTIQALDASVKVGCEGMSHTH